MYIVCTYVHVCTVEPQILFYRILLDHQFCALYQGVRYMEGTKVVYCVHVHVIYCYSITNKETTCLASTVECRNG